MLRHPLENDSKEEPILGQGPMHEIYPRPSTIEGNFLTLFARRNDVFPGVHLGVSGRINED